MRRAETVLSIIHERGKRGLPLKDVYRQLFNPDLYIKAYARIGRNNGALTEGITTETVDGMNLRKIESIIAENRIIENLVCISRRNFMFPLLFTVKTGAFTYKLIAK